MMKIKKENKIVQRLLRIHKQDGNNTFYTFIVLVALVCIGITFLLMMAVLAYNQKHMLVATVNLTFATGLFGLLYLIYKFHHIQLYSEIGIFLMGCHFIFLFINGNVEGTAFVWIYTYPLAAIFLLGLKKGSLYSASLILLIMTSYFLSAYIPHHYVYNINLILRMIPSYFVVLFFSMGWEKTRRISEKNLIKARKIAEETNNAKTEFISHISHELRTPLNAIIGFSELLQNNIDDEKLLSYADAVHLSGKLLLRIINNILDISKIGANKMVVEKHSIFLDKFFNDIYKVFQQQAEAKGIELVISLDQKLKQPIFTDETKLRQIILNLVSNALKFTTNGRITIEAKVLSISHKSVDIDFIVSDTGIGIPKDQQEEIFEAFSQRSGQSVKDFGGTGLGLTITQKLTDLLGGEITLESEEMVGSRFHILLKNIALGEGQNEKPADSKDISNNIDFLGANILIYTKDIFSYAIHEPILNDHNLIVYLFSDIDKIEYNLEKHSPRLIVLELPHSQFSILEKIDELKLKIPVIISVAILKNELKKYHYNEILVRPISPQELISVFAKYIPHNKNYSKPVNKKLLFEQEALSLIKNEFKSSYSSIKNAMIVDEIVDFAQKIISFGKEKNNKQIIEYGKKLYSEADNFLIDRMVNTLKLLKNDED